MKSIKPIFQKSLNGLLGVTLTLYSFQSHSAPELWVPHPNINSTNYEKYLRARSETPAAQTLQQLIEETYEGDEENLKIEFLKAQNLYLNGRLSEALGSFEEIFSKRFDADWTAKSRKFFEYVGLRRIQLSEGKTGQMPGQLHSQLLSFDGDYKADAEIFPPPFIKRLTQWREQEFQRALIWNGENLPLHIQKVLLNGKGLTLPVFTQKLLPNEKYRLTLISHHTVPKTFLLTGREVVAEKEWALKPMISGSCQDPELSSYVGNHFKTVTALFPTACVRKYVNGRWEPANDSSELHTEPPLTPIKKPMAAIEPVTLKSSAMSASGSKTWNWLVLGALTVGSVYLLTNSQKKSSRRPTTRPTHDEAGLRVSF